MQVLGWGVIIAALWLWIEQPFWLAVLGGMLAGALIGYGLRGQSAPERAPMAVLEAPAADSELDRLVSMGFRAEEVRLPLAKARKTGAADPVAYVLGSLIR